MTRIRLAADYALLIAMCVHQGVLYLVEVCLQRKGWR